MTRRRKNKQKNEKRFHSLNFSWFKTCSINLCFIDLVFFSFLFEFERIIYFFFLSQAELYSMNLNSGLTQKFLLTLLKKGGRGKQNNVLPAQWRNYSKLVLPVVGFLLIVYCYCKCYLSAKILTRRGRCEATMEFLMPGGHAYKQPRLLCWKNFLFMIGQIKQLLRSLCKYQRILWRMQIIALLTTLLIPFKPLNLQFFPRLF